MSDTGTPARPKGGTEDPNMAAFGIGGADPAPADADDVTMAPATRSPAGTPPPLPTEAEISGETGEGGAAGGTGESDVAPPPGTDLASDLNAWFDAQKQGGSGDGTVGGTGEPVPPSVDPVPPTVLEEAEDKADPSAPVPIPVLGPDGQPLPPSTAPPVEIPAQITAPQQVSPVEQAFLQQYGRLPSMQELNAMFQVQNDLQNMTPVQRQQVESALYGQAQQATPPAPVPQVDEYGEPVFDPNVIDQRVQQYVAPIQEQLQQTQAFIAQQAQERAEAQQQRVVAEIDSGKATVAQKYNLTAEDTERFVATVADLGILSGLYSRYGNGTQAMEAAMEQVLWADPGFRYVQQQREMNTARVQEADDSQRRRKAGALAGGSGTVSRDEPVPTTSGDRKAAMVTELQQALDQS